MSFIITFSAVSKECNNGSVRLVDGTTLQEGRLEICIDSRWGTVCQDGWGGIDAMVVCRQLGYKENGEPIKRLLILL